MLQTVHQNVIHKKLLALFDRIRHIHLIGLGRRWNSTELKRRVGKTSVEVLTENGFAVLRYFGVRVGLSHCVLNSFHELICRDGVVPHDLQCSDDGLRAFINLKSNSDAALFSFEVILNTGINLYLSKAIVLV